MDSQTLTPLPSEITDENTGYRRVYTEGFVDESAILSVIANGPYERIFVKPEEMVLSSSEDDYAGWSLPVPSPFRSMLDVSNPAPVAMARKPAPPRLDGIPSLSEPGIAEPHRGNHRWWLFGVSGAMTCGIFSLTLLSLAQRSSLKDAMAGYMPGSRSIPAPELAVPEPALVPAVVRVDNAE